MKQSYFLKNLIFRPILFVFFFLSGLLFSQTFTDNNITYSITSTTALTVSVTGSTLTGDIVIPSTVVNAGDGKTYTVTSLASSSFYGKTVNSLTLSNTITSIGTYAFAGASIGSMTLSTSLQTIGDRAFNNVKLLQSLQLPDTVTSIGQYCFYGSSLKTIKLSSSLTAISDYAFQNCFSLGAIEIPNSVQSIGASAFDNSGITSLTLPSSLKTIGVKAFSNCKSLQSVEIPSSVTTIFQYAFQNCTSLANLSFAANSSLTTMGANAFENTGITSLVLPDSLTVIPNSAFRSCYSLSSVTLSKNTTTIGEFAFNSASITSINIPEGTKTIANDVFRDCTFMTSIYFPASLTSIGSYALSGCSSLTTMSSLNTTPPALGTSVFFDVSPTICKLTVPSGSEVAYDNAAQWTDFIDLSSLGLQPVMKPEISIYPNPAIEYVNITNVKKGDDLFIYDLYGRVVYNQKLMGKDQKINVSRFKAGMYIIKINTDSYKLLITN